MPNLFSHAVKQAEGVPLRLDNIVGEKVTVLGVQFSSGSYGSYAIMQVKDAVGAIVEVMTGAKLVIDALENAVADDALPCEACFIQRGRTWLLADPDGDGK